MRAKIPNALIMPKNQKPYSHVHAAIAQDCRMLFANHAGLMAAAQFLTSKLPNYLLGRVVIAHWN
jgi:hypothetical protein